MRFRNHLPPVMNTSAWSGRVGSARLHQIDDRQSVLPGDVLGAQCLGEAVSIGRARLAGGVVGGDDALHPGDDPDPGDGVGPEILVRPPGCQGRQFEERGIPIHQQLDSLPDQELAAGTVTVYVLLSAAQAGLRLEGFELRQFVDHRQAVCDEFFAVAIDPGGQHLHDPRVVSAARRKVRPISQYRARRPLSRCSQVADETFLTASTSKGHQR